MKIARTPLDVLRSDAEPLPRWLANYRAGMFFPERSFFASRTAYYPGSGDDGHLLRIFGKSHTAHCFVHADNFHPAVDLETQILDGSHKHHPKGYRVLDFQHLALSTITPRNWTPQQILFQAEGNSLVQTQPHGGPFALWAVLERQEAFGEEHGPKRIALLHVGADGFAFFASLFCHGANRKLPYAVLLHDHGWGGSWAKFGGDQSPLWHLARDSAKPLPKWLLVADCTAPWEGYARASAGDPGGMYGTARYLYRREP